MYDYKKGYLEIKDILSDGFGNLRQTVIKNLSHLIISLTMLIRTHRGWYGGLSLMGIARVMKTEGNVKTRYKRLSRFLDNQQFQMSDLTLPLMNILVKERDIDFLPLIVDQTTIGDVQVITGSYPYNGRSIPLAMATFEYGKITRSQNYLEETFLSKMADCLPKGTKVVWIMDRGYGKVFLIKSCYSSGWFFIIRGRRETIVEYTKDGKKQRKGLGRLKHKQGKPIRYCNVLYHDKEKVKVDIIVYREKGFKEPWFLIVPAGCQDILPAETVVQWYRRRMNIEVTFRDFKSHLGVRAISLKVRKSARLNRLLSVMVLVYIFLLIFGESNFGIKLREELEVLRSKCRHGTKRTLSVLSIALMAISDSFLFSRTQLIKVLVYYFRKMVEGKWEFYFYRFGKG